MNTMLLLAAVLHFYTIESPPDQATSVTGAWQNQHNSGEIICIADNYFVYTLYDLTGKKFGESWGGPVVIEGSTLTINREFFSKDQGFKPHTIQLPFKKTTLLEIDMQGEKKSFKLLDDGKAPLAGNWRITGRKQGETINPMPLAARRTLKLLTASRFQWTAFNNETGEFSGTGGGSYTFENGKYTEHIEFFSRDNNRVGASLSFEGKLENGDWHHSGLSSRGDPIYEIWSRFK